MSEEIELDATSVLRRNDEVMTADMGEELVMLHLDQDSYFGLDPIGREIWTRLEKPTPFADLCGALCQEFDVDAETCETDVRAFIERLARHDLVTVDGESKS